MCELAAQQISACDSHPSFSVSCPSPGPAGSDAHVPRLSFSAAMTRPMRGVGTIVFDDIFVNERDAYNPRTGEFRRPLSWNSMTVIC